MHGAEADWSRGVAGALWSSSAALVSIVGALNRAYDIDEGRPWWRVRVVAIGLTLSVAVIVLVALSLILVGPTLAEKLGDTTGGGALAVAATILWLLVSLILKFYVANFTDYEGSYGTVGAVVVVLLWFYVSGIAILTGAELNAEIEHASAYGKAPGRKNAQGKRLIGARAARAFRLQEFAGDRVAAAQRAPSTPTSTPKPTLGAVLASAILIMKWWNRRGDLKTQSGAVRTP